VLCSRFTKSSIRRRPWESWGLDKPTPACLPLPTGRVGENSSSENIVEVTCVLKSENENMLKRRWKIEIVSSDPFLINLTHFLCFLLIAMTRLFMFNDSQRAWYIRKSFQILCWWYLALSFFCTWQEIQLIQKGTTRRMWRKIGLERALYIIDFTYTYLRRQDAKAAR